MSRQPDVYSFVYRGNLALESLERVGHRRVADLASDLDAVDKAVSLEVLPDGYAPRAFRMARVFVAISMFENAMRDLIEKGLLEEVGAEWWATCVPEKIRKKAESRKEQELRHKFHTQRGSRLMDYIDFGDLPNIITANWQYFEDIINADQEWCKGVFSAMSQTRNVIMHGGEVDDHDVHRVGMAIRDWVKQVGL